MAESLGRIGEIFPKDIGKTATSNKQISPQGKDFASVLKDTLDETNEIQQTSEKAMVDLSTGQVKDIHQAALAIGKAETHMKLVLEVRNKAISAYKEILRTQM